MVLIGSARKSMAALIACALIGILSFSNPVDAGWKIKSDVDLYEEPGGVGKPIGIVRKNQTFGDGEVQCRADKWCHIPQGWIWGTYLKKADDTGGQKPNADATPPSGNTACSGNSSDNVLWGDYCYTNQNGGAAGDFKGKYQKPASP